ncbi:glycosyltransferase family 2 protein [Edwardsiella tarda]|uniref:glycosyltransferase family 2 protein n=1 Tax=Edwardsiella TaxID=635 RepID=UPI00351C6510
MITSDKPEASFLIPAYNCDDTIRETLLSALNQTVRNIEVVVVDDGSTDNTKSEIESINDNRLIYIYKENGGISSALNLGLKYCRSEFIARLDSDDLAHEDRIEMQLKEFAKNPSLVLIGTGVDYIDSNSKLVGKLFPIYFKSLEKIFFSKGNIYQHPSVMFRKEAVINVGLYDDNLSGFFEDYYLWAKLKEFGQCKIIPASLTSYRISEGQITNWLPSDEYKKLMLKIVKSGNYTNDELKQLSLLKKRDKVNSKNISSNRIESASNNIFYRIDSLLNVFFPKSYSYYIVCTLKNILLMFKSGN